MASTIWLECGEDGSDRLDLMSAFGGGPGILVLAEGPDIVDDAASDEWQMVTLPLLIKGANRNDLLNRRRAILTKLNQARAGVQPGSGLPMVNVAIKLDGANELVRWYVADGELDRGGWDGIASNVIGHNGEPAVLTLRVYRGGLGEVIEYGPFDVGGDEMTFHVNGIPGDLPALAEMVVEDDSTGGVAINRLRIASRSLPDMDEGDFAAILPLGVDDGGDPDPDTVIGFPVIQSVESTWQDIATVTQDADIGGVFDVFARLRDETGYLGVPGKPTAYFTTGISTRQSNGWYANNAAVTSITATFTNTSLAGNLLWAYAVTSNGAAITTPSGWTQAWNVAHGGGNGPRAALFYRENAPAIDSLTVTIGSSTGYLIISEISGLDPTAPLDVTSTNTATSATTGGTGSSGALDQAYSLAVAGFAIYGGAAGAYSISSPPSGWTGIYSNAGAHPSPFAAAAFAVWRQITSSTSAINLTATTAANRNWVGGVAVFKGALSNAPTLGAETYSFAVAAIDAFGRSSVASNVETITTSVSGAIQLEWAPSPGPVTKYRIYRRVGSGAWAYWETADATPAYTVTVTSGATSGIPPSDTTIELSDFRFFFGRENSVMQQPPIGPIRVSLGSDTWEWAYIRRMHLPPSSSPLVGPATGWTAIVQGRAIAPTNLGIDALALLPADEGHLVDAAFVPNNLSTPRDWRIWTTVTGHSNGYLSDGGDEAGNLRVRGRLMLGPGDTTVVMLPDIAGGISRVEDVAMSVTVWVRPRFLWLAGTS